MFALAAARDASRDATPRGFLAEASDLGVPFGSKQGDQRLLTDATALAASAGASNAQRAAWGQQGAGRRLLERADVGARGCVGRAFSPPSLGSMISLAVKSKVQPLRQRD
jgi:hypothetical protein